MISVMQAGHDRNMKVAITVFEGASCSYPQFPSW